jgi:hypothetical protein
MRALHWLTLCLMLGSTLVFVHISACQAQPSAKQLEAARAIRTVRLQVDQRLIKKHRLELPFEETARQILGPAGIIIVGHDEAKPDAILKVKVWLQEIGADVPPSKEEFGPHGEAGTLIRVYFAARLFGDLTLEQCRPDRIIHQARFDSGMHRRDSGILRLDILNVESDLVGMTFFAKNSVACAFARMSYELYGPDILVQAMQVPDYQLISGIAEAWVSIGPAAVEPLLLCFTAESELTRERAAWALGELKDKRAVPKLIEVLNDRSYFVRAQAARSLSLIGDEAAVGPLIEAITPKGGYVRVGRVEGGIALSQLTGQSFGDDYEAWRKWWETTR